MKTRGWFAAAMGLGLWACGGGEVPTHGADAGADDKIEAGGGEPEATPEEDAGNDEASDAGAEHNSAPATGAASSAMIGPEGGTLSTSDGRITLQVPKGALSADKLIQITPIENAAPGHTGQAFQLSPEGIHFDVPVTLSFHYDDADVEGSTPNLLRVAFRDAQGWHMLRERELDVATKTVRVQSDHFSDWSLVLGAVLLPHQATVKVGQSIQLKVSVCLQEHVEHDGDVSAQYGYDCEEQPLVNSTLYGWSVNGVLGGDDLTGRLRPESDPRSGRAMYDAPRQKPAGNPVAVSVQLRDSIFGNEILVSSVKVLDDSAKWTGTVTYEVDGSHVFPPNSGYVGDVTQKFHHQERFEIVGVRGRTGPSTYLRVVQTTQVTRSEKGTRTKQVYSSCQAGAPAILRDDWFYSIDKELSGNLASEAIEGRIYIDPETGKYDLTLDYQSTPLEGHEKVVSTYRNGCNGAMTDDSHDKQITSSEAMPYEPKVEGVIDPDQPLVLKGSYPLSYPNDILGTKGWVTWELTRSDDGT